MITRFSPIEPDEERTVAFEFGPGLTTVSAPTISVSLFSGEDVDAATMLLGSPSVSGSSVLQRIRGRLDGVDYAIECRVTSGLDNYTIDAILPVRSRPVAPGLSARYCTEAQFSTRFGDTELAELLAYGNGFASSENDAASLIDGYLASRYALPLLYVPALITGLAADIARFKLWGQRAPDEVRKRYEDALAQLRDIAAGRIVLPPDSTGMQASTGVEFGGYSAERTMTADTLAGF